MDNKPTVFLFNDTQVVEESFLEDINNILSSGEVPNLYKPDEFEEVKQALAGPAKKDGVPDQNDAMFAYLIERVRNNLHIILCMSPVGDPFRCACNINVHVRSCSPWFCSWFVGAIIRLKFGSFCSS